MNRELLQQALDYIKETYDFCAVMDQTKEREEQLIKALEQELAKPEPVVLFIDNEEGLCIQLECNGSYYLQNLSDCDAAKFFVDAYRRLK
jgi:hypothetical protein